MLRSRPRPAARAARESRTTRSMHRNGCTLYGTLYGARADSPVDDMGGRCERTGWRGLRRLRSRCAQLQPAQRRPSTSQGARAPRHQHDVSVPAHERILPRGMRAPRVARAVARRAEACDALARCWSLRPQAPVAGLTLAVHIAVCERARAIALSMCTRAVPRDSSSCTAPRRGQQSTTGVRQLEQ